MDGIDMVDGPIEIFVDLETGEIVEVLKEQLESIEEFDEEEMEELLKDEEMKLVYDVFLHYGARYLSLPDKYEIDEYGMMSDFCESLGDNELSEAMCQAIRGRGAFGRFKDGIHEYRIADDWYRFREEAFREFAINWCTNNDLSYIE